MSALPGVVPSAGVELTLQALPVLRQLAALHQAREHGIAVVAVAVLAGETQPEDQQQALALRFKRAKEQAVAIRQTQDAGGSSLA